MHEDEPEMIMSPFHRNLSLGMRHVPQLIGPVHVTKLMT